MAQGTSRAVAEMRAFCQSIGDGNYGSPVLPELGICSKVQRMCATSGSCLPYRCVFILDSYMDKRAAGGTAVCVVSTEQQIMINGEILNLTRTGYEHNHVQINMCGVWNNFRHRDSNPGRSGESRVS